MPITSLAALISDPEPEIALLIKVGALSFGLDPPAQMIDIARKKVSFFPTFTTHVFPITMLTDDKVATASWVGMINLFSLMANLGGYEYKGTQYNTAAIQVTTTFNGSGIRALSGSNKIKPLNVGHFIGIHAYLDRLSVSGIYYPDVIEP
jgi:hypothetical protein